MYPKYLLWSENGKVASGLPKAFVQVGDVFETGLPKLKSKNQGRLIDRDRVILRSAKIRSAGPVVRIEPTSEEGESLTVGLRK